MSLFAYYFSIFSLPFSTLLLCNKQQGACSLRFPIVDGRGGFNIGSQHPERWLKNAGEVDLTYQNGGVCKIVCVNS